MVLLLPQQMRMLFCYTLLLLMVLIRQSAPFRPPTSSLVRRITSTSKILRPWLTSTTTATKSSSTGSTTSKDSTISPATEVESSSSTSSQQLRPLQQNWWSVSALSALDKTRPNELQLLGLSLVAFYSSSNHNGWAVLDDRCSHRFAPLSEGRVVPDANSAIDGSCHLQCAYHGWEFTGDGTCVKVPQQPDNTDKARSVTSYPTRVRAGMLWVWADPSTKGLSDSIPLPVNALLDQWVEQFGEDSVFQRDLPYGLEILGENLLDLSHLPYAHHSLGGLRRSLGEELPTRMMSQNERDSYAQWEIDSTANTGKTNATTTIVVPTYQAEIMDAAQHDPVMKGIAKRSKKSVDETRDWRCTIGFFSPNHVRYRRTRGGPDTAIHVELFLCPRSESRSRVLLFNTFAGLLQDPSQLTISQRIQNALLSKLFDPKSVRGHLLGHQIFDGDGIFLHKQGNRMKQSQLTFRDYSTPSSADVLLNAYRRWMDRLATITVSDDSNPQTSSTLKQTIANSVVGTGAYGGDLDRHVMLDRYNTHTKYCPTCRTALKKARNRRSQWQLLQTALAGTTGAAATLWMATWMLVPSVASQWLVSWTRSATLLAALGTYLAGRSIQSTEKRIQKFLFEDYVHAEKD